MKTTSYLPDPVLLRWSATFLGLLGSVLMGSFAHAQQDPIIIIVQPADQTVVECRSVNFNVAVEGSPTITYQWYCNGCAIPGAESSSYAIAVVGLADNGNTYWVRVANAINSVDSSIATLTVIPDTVPPVIVSAQAQCGDTHVLVTFDELLDPSTASDQFNYTIDAGAGNVVSATLEPDGKTVSLVLSAPLIGGDHVIGVQNVEDCAGNAIVPDSRVLLVVDREAPVAGCVPTTNPAGNTIPSAGNNPKSGQNPDGFYQLLGADNCDGPAALTIFVMDTASPFVAGPFASGDKMKITQAPGVTPSQQPMAGVIVAHIRLKGDAVVFSIDSSGNISAPCFCLVPPRPK